VVAKEIIRMRIRSEEVPRNTLEVITRNEKERLLSHFLFPLGHQEELLSLSC